jgi:hypothetical protein
MNKENYSIDMEAVIACKDIEKKVNALFAIIKSMHFLIPPDTTYDCSLFIDFFKKVEE